MGKTADGQTCKMKNDVVPAKATLIGKLDNIRRGVVDLTPDNNIEKFRQVDAEIIQLRRHLERLPIK
jgi:hypothetical protein